jgi:BirA family biotin operon repressor/biotin-[acetyl-CoA-carboxylase] ligase
MSFDIASVRAALPVRDIRWFETIDSTMREAARIVDEGAPSGTAVVANEQTSGYGRFGRSWHSEPDTGLYLSVILRFPFPDAPGLVTMALGLAVREAILDATGVVCDLRWPNDLLIGDRKCAGILTQLEGAALIAGIGINVNQSKFPVDIAPIATSLRIAAAGEPFSREKLLIRLLPAVDEWCGRLAHEGREPILRTFHHVSSYVSGRRVTVEISEDESITGTTAGLDAEGYLLVWDDNGREHTIIAGGVRPA